MPRQYIQVSSGEEDNDDEYKPPTQSQGPQLMPQQSAKLAGHICNFLLVSESKKIPAKQGDIRKLVLKEHSRHLATVMTEANNIMEKVFGYKIKEVPNNTYILVNTLSLSAGEGSAATEAQAARTGLITAILAAIFMNDYKMQEGAMDEYLKTLGMDMHSREPHPLLGNVHKLIHQDLVRERYLLVTQDTSVDPPCREYQWGDRANLELSKKDILELVCKVYGDSMRPEIWTSQWKEVEKETSSQET